MLYFYYLFKQCGEEKLFWDIAGNDDSFRGEQNIDVQLQKLKFGVNIYKAQCENFKNSAINFEIARAHNQVRYDLPNNQKIHYYYGTTSQLKFSKIVSSNSLKQRLDRLPFYSSLIIKNSYYSQAKHMCPKCRFYWSNQNFPYQVSDVQPLNTQTWKLIVIKVTD